MNINKKADLTLVIELILLIALIILIGVIIKNSLGKYGVQ